MSDSNYFRYDFQNMTMPLRKKNNYFLHIALFAATFVTSMISGTQWVFKDFFEITNWQYGFTYAVLLMTFLSFHEFGHYFASRYHKVDATLPYYIPMPLPFIINFGTFGAVIKTRSPIPNRKALFDIGVSGPVAGFVVSFAILVYGLLTLPPIDYLYSIHPEYLLNYGGRIPTTDLHFGDTILYYVLSNVLANPNGFLPPMNEIYHYPFLCVGWFGLFVTTLNLLPLGQLDGGHICYAMFGKLQSKISKVFWWFMIIIGAGSFFEMLYELLKIENSNRLIISLQNLLLPLLSDLRDAIPWFFNCWGGWLFWAIITKFFIKLDHPPVPGDENIGSGRKALGWFAFAILILSFSFNGIYFVE